MTEATELLSAEAPCVTARMSNANVLTLTLNRPHAFNALSLEVMTTLTEEIKRASASDEVRVIVIAGAGKAFSAGHDLGELYEQTSVEDAKAIFSACTDMMLTMAESAKPIIAQVHGVAAAAGCQLVAAADLAVAASGTRFSVSGINLGLFCSTPMVALTRNVPRKFAMEMLLTGAFIDAETACRYGLVNRVVEGDKLDEAVADLAAEVASKSPLAIAAGKRLFYEQIEAALHVAYENAGAVMAQNLISEDAKAGIRAFLHKAPTPPWKGR